MIFCCKIQIWSILTLAIVGTGMAAGIITLGLYLFYSLLIDSGMSVLHLVTFSSIIAAVDPVAVLAVFEEVQVDAGLYYLVFGEALLNDGVTFVLFEGFRSLAILNDVSSLPTESYIFVLLSFLTSPTGGLLIGIMFGIMTSLFTRFTEEKISYLEPGIVLCFGFLSHVTATKLGWSGILALIGCGLAQKRYAFANLSEESKHTVLNLAKTIAMSCEVLIFVLLGNSLAKSGGWDWPFIGISILMIYISRGLVTVFLCFIINIFRKEKIDFRWQAVIYLGGLRGAIANVMVLSYEGEFHEVFSDTTLVIIFLTVILNGLLAKPCINYFDLGSNEKENDEDDLFLPPFTSFESRFIVPYFIRKRSLSSPSVKCPESLATLSAANKHGCMQEISTDTNAMSGANNYGFTSDHYISDGADLY